MRLVIWPVILMSFSCATSSPRASLTVVERADDLSEKPEWASVSNSTWEENGKKFFVGFTSLPADVNVSAALNMSDEKAFSEPMRSMVDSFLDQNQVGETLRDDSSAMRIISATRGFRPAMPGLHIVKRYYESVAIVIGEEIKTELRCYSLAEIPNREFADAKSKYLARLSHNSEVNQILREVGEKQRDAAEESK